MNKENDFEEFKAFLFKGVLLPFAMDPGSDLEAEKLRGRNPLDDLLHDDSEEQSISE